jgi:hypothetical protein
MQPEIEPRLFAFSSPNAMGIAQAISQRREQYDTKNNNKTTIKQ